MAYFIRTKLRAEEQLVCLIGFYLDQKNPACLTRPKESKTFLINVRNFIKCWNFVGTKLKAFLCWENGNGETLSIELLKNSKNVFKVTKNIDLIQWYTFQ